ncbi:HNH endonuclease [Iodidimonas gelatinilytica]|uniref:HNH endonuclease n=1 Tax=Iodidimonas gelatinilytica TaxID=1236966 RepID=UPI003530CCA0
MFTAFKFHQPYQFRLQDIEECLDNGVALCALHHRAYDRGLLTFDSGYRIHRSEPMEGELVSAGLNGGLADFWARLSL